MADAWVGSLIFAFGIVGSSMCSGLETGFYCISGLRLRLRLGRAEPDPAAVHVQAELDKPDRLLTTLLIWNNIFNYIASLGLASMMLQLGLSEGWVIALQALVLTPMLLVLAESLPKELFRMRADVLPYRLVNLVRVFRWTAMPILPLVLWCARLVARRSAHSDPTADRRDRISTLLKESAMHGAISPVQASLIDRAIELARTPVGELASPLAGEMIDTSNRAVLEAAARRWAPEPVVVLRTRSTVAGIIDPVAVPGRPLAVQPPLRLDANMSARDALAAMSSSGARSAVVSARGRDIGVVTARSLAKPLLAAIQEERVSE